MSLVHCEHAAGSLIARLLLSAACLFAASACGSESEPNKEDAFVLPDLGGGGDVGDTDRPDIPRDVRPDTQPLDA